jgi:hypothetical protein
MTAGGAWFRHTRARRQDRVHAGGVAKDVAFGDTDPAVNDQIDAAYLLDPRLRSRS